MPTDTEPAMPTDSGVPTDAEPVDSRSMAVDCGSMAVDVARIVADLLDVDQAGLTPATLLADIEGWDSVNQLRLLLHLERDLSAPLDYDRFLSAASLADLVLLARHTAAGTA
ncbi:hypothetical protein GCM10022403_067450 [Streptomyces coacervatus]|uniref:Carrier domain-containing protein n=1 Tax=Streptomyces coacervatus TaxID=647381 RepID=A0ABP7IRB8_9ACTN|nr:acyl carrier protein [Streptomyces coacervatus]MDF2266830.1 acyl carrier protein [Streptomyces coacervatus]